MESITFERIEPSVSDWNVIENTYDSTVYMTQAWFDYLIYQHCRPFIVKIKSQNEIIGYFVGEMKWRGMWLLGAPIEGVGTGNQGLAMLRKVDAQERIDIYKAFAKWVFKKRYVSWIQIEDWQLIMNDLKESDLIYEGHDTSWIDLTKDKEVLFHNMHNKSCRHKINKAIREGTQIREAKDADSFLDTHFDQCLSVMHSKGLEPRRSKEHLKEFIRILYPKYLLLLEAYEPEGKVIATGMYLVNNKSASSFSSAGYREYSRFCANEYIYWEAYLRCKAKGARFFNNNGSAPFKLKFGPNREYKPRIIFTRFGFLLNVRKWFSDFYHKVWRLMIYSYKSNKATDNQNQ